MNLFYPITAFLFRIFFRLFYHLKVYGTASFYEGGAVIAPNHASYYDPPVIGVSCPGEVHYLARIGLFQKPFLRFFITRLNAHPVTATARDTESFKMIRRLISEGKKVVIFPEGVRSPDGVLNPVKPGIAMLALLCKCPVIPVYIHGTYEVWNRDRKYPKLSGKIACVFGAPINWKEYASLDKTEGRLLLTDRVRHDIEALKQWYENGAKGPIPGH